MRTTTSVLLLLAAVFLAPLGADLRVEVRKVATVSSADLDKGIVSQLAWDHNVLVIQGAVPDATGQISARYFRIAEPGVGLTLLNEPTREMLAYWDRKSSRLSPTGLGKITSATDTQIPLNTIQGREATLQQVNEMGGMVNSQMLRMGSLVIFKRTGQPPYDGETYSWSPPELNRLAYTDANGDLWIVRAEGGPATRLLKGDYTLPAWSDDGRTIAVAQRKDGGKQWDVFVVYLPSDFK